MQPHKTIKSSSVWVWRFVETFTMKMHAKYFWTIRKRSDAMGSKPLYDIHSDVNSSKGNWNDARHICQRCGLVDEQFVRGCRNVCFNQMPNLAFIISTQTNIANVWKAVWLDTVCWNSWIYNMLFHENAFQYNLLSVCVCVGVNKWMHKFAWLRNAETRTKPAAMGKLRMLSDSVIV